MRFVRYENDTHVHLLEFHFLTLLSAMEVCVHPLSGDFCSIVSPLCWRCTRSGVTCESCLSTTRYAINVKFSAEPRHRIWWAYTGRFYGLWYYGPVLSDELESRYQEYLTNPTNYLADVYQGVHKYEIDFRNMQQTSMTGFVRNLKRIW